MDSNDDPQNEADEEEGVQALNARSPSFLTNKERLESMGTLVFETQEEDLQRKPFEFMDSTGDTECSLLSPSTERKNALPTFEDDAKLNLGDFRALALTDVDGPLLRLPGDVMEQLVDPDPMGKRRQDERQSLSLSSSSSQSVPASTSSSSENAVNERGRLRIHNVGGSLTILLQIALLAWGIRQLRSVLAKRRQKQVPCTNIVPFRPSELPHYSALSPVAVKKLVESNCTPHVVVDVRFPEAVTEHPLPLKDTVNVPELEVRAFFQLSEAERVSRFPSVKNLDRSQLVVFVSTKGRRAQRAAVTVAELGFNRCCVLSGGVLAYHAFITDASEQVQPNDPSFLSRDTVALLMESKQQHQLETNFSLKPYLIDVRRHDERVLYGHIHGSVHVPVDEWPKALNMELLDWERSYGFPKFQKEDLLILYCRTNNRSSWATQVAFDAGVTRCFVCKGGVLGWLLDANVLPYNGYALGDPPPEPLKFEIEMLNYEVARHELQQLQPSL